MADKKERLYKKPNPFTYGFIKLASKIICKVSYRLKVVRNELKGSRGRRVVIANHESSIDFMTAYSIVPKRTHLVISNAFLNTSPIRKIIESAGAIGKNQFKTTLTDMKRLKAVLDNGGVVYFYPAGLMSESGASTPIPPATGKTLKWFNADVYVAKVSGTYFLNPKWSKVKRKGKTSLDVYKLASKEELESMSVEELSNLVETHLSFDAYRNNEVNKVAFKNGDNVVGLENVLYKCPSCGVEYSIEAVEDNVLACNKCGYKVKSDKYGLLSAVGDTDAVFKYPSDWHAYIEDSVYQSIKDNKDYSLQTSADIYMINEKKHRFEKAGHGTVRLNFDEFIIDANLFGQEFHKTVYAGDLPILPFVPGERFEIQDGTDIYRIVPDDGRIVMKWIFTLKSAFKIRHEQ
ncbi:MAG: hypothetical protein E7369_05745 [Clostridiales bacterium]|nr:hypothetical protein [Clostridiales bacterium]